MAEVVRFQMSETAYELLLISIIFCQQPREAFVLFDMNFRGLVLGVLSL